MLGITNSWAGWTSAGETEEVNEYIDLTSIKRSENFVKLWVMHDYKSVQHITGFPPYLTLLDQDEYDCKDGRRRTLARFMYSDNMGKGKLLATLNDPSKFNGWTPNPPGSMGESILKVVCKKK